MRRAALIQWHRNDRIWLLADVEERQSLRPLCDLKADVRGLGLQLAVELSREGRKAVNEAECVLYGCLARGLSFKVSDGNVITLSPPLTITAKQLDEACDILDDAIGEVEAAS